LARRKDLEAPYVPQISQQTIIAVPPQQSSNAQIDDIEKPSTKNSSRHVRPGDMKMMKVNNEFDNF
jgi:hypothetical protein